jgi:hypothetical protein
MNPIRRIRRIAGVLAGLACAWLGLAIAAPAAFAAGSVPPPGSGSAVITRHESLTGGLPAPLAAHIHQLAPQAPGPVPAHVVFVGGMPGWQIALIAAAAALIAATIAVLADRARTARRTSATTAA